MLKGARVVLRPMEPEDALVLTGYSNDVEVELLSGGTPPIPYPAEFWRSLIERRAKAEGRPEADFVIEADGRTIGYCGLFHFEHTARRAELGITIGDRAYWGRGYGREVVGLLLDYGFRIRNLHKICLTVNGDNGRAQRCYSACGFAEEGRLRDHAWNNGRYIDIICMGVLREQWGTQLKADSRQLTAIRGQGSGS